MDGADRAEIYRLASSGRFVLRESELEDGAFGAAGATLFLWHEVAHHRFSYLGNSHIFVHCFPVSNSHLQ